MTSSGAPQWFSFLKQEGDTGFTGVTVGQNDPLPGMFPRAFEEQF